MEYPIVPIVGYVLQAVGYGLVFTVGWLWKARKASVQEEELIKDAVRALIRDRLIHKYERATTAGWCSVEYLTDIESLYETYKALGGNGIVPGLIAKVKSLPSEPPSNA